VTPLFARVAVIVALAVPLNEAVPVTSPDRPSDRAVASAVAVPALPEIEPTIVLEKVLIPATVWSPESPTKAPGPPMAMTEVAVPPAPPVPVP